MINNQIVHIMCLVLMTSKTSIYGGWTKYSVYNGWRLNAGSTVLTRNQYECAWHAQMTDSAALSFRSEKECRTASDVPKLIKGQEGDVVYFAPISNWNKKMFIKGDIAYSYLFNEAVQVCTGFGARLMEAFEVQQVLDTTWFTSCSCGWTWEGVTKTIDGPECNVTTRAITTCSGVITAHAWCYKSV